MSLSFHVFTLFPELFPGPLEASVLGRGLKNACWSINSVDIRTFALNKHRTVDDTPCGGGPGMVMKPDVIDRAFHSVYEQKRPDALIYLSPRGRPLTQSRVKELARFSKIGLLCGRFEGVDQRVIDHWQLEEISLGDYVLSGGELAAMVLIDACVRLVPGVLGCTQSIEDESFSEGLLEYPHYTRPQVWNGMAVPDILTSGHHEKVKTWRSLQSETLTQTRRPDLWEQYRLNMQLKSKD